MVPGRCLFGSNGARAVPGRCLFGSNVADVARGPLAPKNEACFSHQRFGRESLVYYSRKVVCWVPAVVYHITTHQTSHEKQPCETAANNTRQKQTSKTYHQQLHPKDTPIQHKHPKHASKHASKTSSPPTATFLLLYCHDPTPPPYPLPPSPPL
jgi:hypothetical protein